MPNLSHPKMFAQQTLTKAGVAAGVCGARLRYAAYREYVGNLEEHVSNFALQEGPLGRSTGGLGARLFPKNGRCHGFSF